jgi:hypothetical protein
MFTGSEIIFFIKKIASQTKMRLVIAILGTVLCPLSVEAIETLVYPAEDSSEYPLHLLKKALETRAKDYTLVPSKVDFPQTRSLIELAQGTSKLDVVWTMTSKEREAQLIPIRIPIYKGLIGWRIPLIHKSQVRKFKSIVKITQLQSLQAGQIMDWPDATILEHNKFLVTRAPSFAGMYEMLAAGRIDYFPRSVIEIWPELQNNSNKNLVVDSNLLIYYPTAVYFFVSKTRSQLAYDITMGLNTLIADGEFDRLLHYYLGGYIQKAKLNSRVKFLLTNPLLPAETPVDQAELWF